MKKILQFYQKNKEIQEIYESIDNNVKEQLISGLVGSGRVVFFAAMLEQLKRPQVIITHNLLSAQKIYGDYTQIFEESSVWLYPADEFLTTEISIASPELRASRIEVLNALILNKVKVLIVPVSGFRKILPPVSLWEEMQLKLSLGEELDTNEFIQKIIKMGYTREEMVHGPGDFSVRGCIIDIYPLTKENPVRIELFDTEIDSIRTFSTEDQRSLERKETVVISPAKETLRTKQIDLGVPLKIKNALKVSLNKIKNEGLKKDLIDFSEEAIAQFQNSLEVKQIYKYVNFLYDSPTSLLDFMPADTVVIIDEIARVMDTNVKLEKEEADYVIGMIEAGQWLHDMRLSHSFPEFLRNKKFPTLYFSTFISNVAHTAPQKITTLTGRHMQEFHGQLHLLKNEIERWKKTKTTVFVLGRTLERVKKISSILEDFQIPFYITPPSQDYVTDKLNLFTGELQNGFEVPGLKIAVISEGELFKKSKSKPSMKRQKISNAERIQSYSELKIGDFVVHLNHGIGKYLGIVTLEIGGIHKDYLHISYRGNDTLYVPVDQIDQVQKYTSSEGKEPKIYKLGGAEWKKVKQKAAKQAEDIAEDLIKLYSARQLTKGYAFSKDSALQQEFESYFPYQETVDQLRSIQEIKMDMESEHPMDRLLCGDVGYGKTEVALRAAFKAIMDGKQVAILVPTTILAQQHFQTMCERFAEFPINIRLMNRFVSKNDLKDTVDKLKKGTVDVVVGTHRILSNDVVFKDLGLLVVDEEQRFGVKHKEKIKQMKASVDVLTLSATPIPRTLHMSMLGVRDLSILETPPENRYPIQTYVLEYQPDFVREAIERELSRDGQVYYLYNRVEDIERVAEEIGMLVPEARVGFAHGRMNENELEAVILAFLDHQYDVLVSTTIIETGIDIPNVNTLVVTNADKMGLSQLYQLRGRVGRSSRVAYAYFTYQRDKVLTEVAEKRLQAIKEFTELGSGFKIAMRDLSIRGTGNLLGAQQHGFIDSVGFELFSEMIKDAIEERKNDKPVRRKNVIEIDVELDAYIPGEYIKDPEQKIDMYKKILSIETKESLFEVQEELMDRFGEFPKQVGDLFSLAEIKVYGFQVGLLSLKQKNHAMALIFKGEALQSINLGDFYSAQINKFGKRFNINPKLKEGVLEILLDVKTLHPDVWMEQVKQVLISMTNLIDLP